MNPSLGISHLFMADQFPSPLMHLLHRKMTAFCVHILNHYRSLQKSFPTAMNSCPFRLLRLIHNKAWNLFQHSLPSMHLMIYLQLNLMNLPCYPHPKPASCLCLNTVFLPHLAILTDFASRTMIQIKRLNRTMRLWLVLIRMFGWWQCNGKRTA